MGTEGLRRQANFTAHIAARGAETLVNGQTVKALWQPAQLSRVQMFLQEELWGRPYYEVKFPASVLQAPTSLQAGNNVTWLSRGYLGRVAQVIPEDSDDEIIQVTALVEMIPS